MMDDGCVQEVSEVKEKRRSKEIFDFICFVDKHYYYIALSIIYI